MTEAEWLAADGPDPMLKFLNDRTSARKLRLFAVACCRRLGPLLCDDVSYRQAVEVAEQFAEGLRTEKQRSAARSALTGWIEQSTFGRVLTDTAKAALKKDAIDAALDAGRGAAQSIMWSFRDATPAVGQDEEASHSASYTALLGEESQQVRLLRDIFGNPFRPITFSPEWLTDTVVSLAKGMYESRDFNAMPILADALQDAGCDHEDLLTHCRGNGPHVRGCWVVDLVRANALNPLVFSVESVRGSWRPIRPLVVGS